MIHAGQASRVCRQTRAAHRPETPEEAIALDRWLADAWGGHPRCRGIDNAGRDWAAKSKAARAALAELMDLAGV